MCREILCEATCCDFIEKKGVKTIDSTQIHVFNHLLRNIMNVSAFWTQTLNFRRNIGPHTAFIQTKKRRIKEKAVKDVKQFLFCWAKQKGENVLKTNLFVANVWWN